MFLFTKAYYIEILIISGLIFLGVLPAFINHANVGYVFLSLLFFSFAAVNQAFFVTTFFSNAKLAGDIYTFWVSLSSIIYYVVFFVNKIRTNPTALYCFSLLP